MPREVFDEDDVEVLSQNSLDCLLAVTTNLFDHCVPNQPEFSSSIAAVTILLDATELALPWKRWFIAAGSWRRLKFIRRLMIDEKHYFFEDSDDSHADNESYYYID